MGRENGRTDTCAGPVVKCETQLSDADRETHMQLDPRFTSAIAERYTIVRQLGVGGMGTVYLARDVRHDRDVALKVLRAELSQSLGRERFLREIRLAARLTHPHILPLHDSGEVEGSLYFVMPVMQGQTLRDRLDQEKPLAVETAVRIAVEVADALDYAHRHDVVHRDIKPENILLHEGHAVVADFGIGKAIAAATNESTTLTQTGMSIGTPAYMSPEQASGDEIDGRSDLFSLGCVLYEMLTGEVPFIGPTVQAVIAKRFIYVPPDVSTVRSAVPASVSEICARLLEKTPAERQPTGAAVAEALRSQETPVVKKPKAEEKSVAVLPFTNMSADPENEYFSDGITEEIINALTQVRGVKIAARASAFSFKGRNDELAVIGHKLGVKFVLQGSVRRSGNRVRVTAQLMSASDGYQLWSERFDRELDDIFAIQDDIARSIVEHLELTLDLKTDAMIAKPTEDLEAYQLYLRGRESVRARTHEALRRGLDLHSQALARDPNYAQAHAGIAEAYIGLGVYQYMPPAEANVRAQRSLAETFRLQPGLPFALMLDAQRMLYLGHDLRATGEAIARVVETQPNDALTRAYEAMYAAISCDQPRRRAAAKRAIELDPLSSWVHGLVGMSAVVFGGDYAEALKWTRTGLELDPNSVLNLWMSAIAHRYRGNLDEAVRQISRATELAQRSSIFVGLLGHILAAAGRTDEARLLRRELEQREQHEYVGPIGYLVIDVAMGDEEAIATSLERCVAAKTGPFTYAPTLGSDLLRLLDHPRLGPIARRTALFADSPSLGRDARSTLG